jgi:alanine racemase
MPVPAVPAPLLRPDVVGASGYAVRPTHVQVDLTRIARNLQVLRQHVGPTVGVMAILKANAYGHGLVPVARHLEHAGVDAVGVAYLEEGVLLRRAGVHTPILVLGGIVDDQIPAFIEHNLALTAPSPAKLAAIQRTAAQMGRVARVHLKLDTGMGRIGVRWTGAAPMLQRATHCPNIAVEGIFSHFANADIPDLTHARTQLARFQEVLRTAHTLGLRPRWRHMANSGGIHLLPESHLDLVRPGIALFGVSPSADVPLLPGLKPALRWVSRVVFFKAIPPGMPISYGSTWAPTRRTRIVTVPVGYGDGYFRALSNRARVILRGRTYPVVGRVCMDQLLVDIGGDSAWNGDTVTLMGESEGQLISAEALAAHAGTIPYEVLTNINTRVPRVYRST